MSDQTMQAFRETGAYLKGHFRLTSGLHSDEYLQCALVLQHPAIAERMGRELAALLPVCDLIASPALGGLIIGHEVARSGGVRFIFTERDPAGKMDIVRIAGAWLKDSSGVPTRAFQHICWDGCMFPNQVMLQDATWRDILSTMIAVRNKHGWD